MYTCNALFLRSGRGRRAGDAAEQQPPRRGKLQNPAADAVAAAMWALRQSARKAAMRALSQSACSSTASASRETCPPSTPLNYTRVRGGCRKGGASRAATGDLGGPPPPCLEGAMAAHAHDAVSTQLHYNGGKGNRCSPSFPPTVENSTTEAAPGRSPGAPPLNLSLVSIHLGLELEEAPCPAICSPAGVTGGPTRVSQWDPGRIHQSKGCPNSGAPPLSLKPTVDAVAGRDEHDNCSSTATHPGL